MNLQPFDGIAMFGVAVNFEMVLCRVLSKLRNSGHGPLSMVKWSAWAPNSADPVTFRCDANHYLRPSLWQNGAGCHTLSTSFSTLSSPFHRRLISDKTSRKISAMNRPGEGNILGAMEDAEAQHFSFRSTSATATESGASTRPWRCTFPLAISHSVQPTSRWRFKTRFSWLDEWAPNTRAKYGLTITWFHSATRAVFVSLRNFFTTSSTRASPSDKPDIIRALASSTAAAADVGNDDE